MAPERTGRWGASVLSLGWMVADACARELLGFAAFGILLLGLDDLAFDAAWAVSAPWRGRVERAVRVAPGADTRLAVLIPAWDEGAVIGSMLRHMVRVWTAPDLRILVGVYPNDPVTRAAVAAVAADDARVAVVMVDHAGPTTKADCLNRLWRQVRADGWAEAVILHDAEDRVAAGEPALLGRLIATRDMVQLPVLPTLSGRSVGDSYFDEFAEAHGKDLPTRQALGASVPGAGVGCAIRCDALARLDEGAGPFSPDSLVEDYELGLRLHASGARTLFVPLAAAGGAVVRAQFPTSVLAATRQKSRWVAGIALNGWDRIGWRLKPAELWMRVRDRRAPLAALVLCAGYAGLLFGTALALFHLLGWTAAPSFLSDRWLTGVSGLTAALLLWRLAVRAVCSGVVGGWREGLRAVPRSITSNIVAILAARRAVGLYFGWRRTGQVRWDKTAHEFAPEPAP